MSIVLLFLFGFLSFAIGIEAEALTSKSHVCTNSTTFRPNTSYSSNLNLLLSSLTSNASLHDGFFRTTVSPSSPSAINGLFLCRGDATPALCQDCVAAAAKEIRRLCPNQTESIIWYDMCLLRYSNQSLNSLVPIVSLRNDDNVASSEHDEFENLLSAMLNDVAAKANTQTGKKKFATAEVKFNSSRTTLYGLAQCIPDLSNSDCNVCFRSAIASIPTCCSGSKGATLLLPACGIRFELYPFFNVTHTPSSASLPPHLPSASSNISIIIAIVVPIIVTMALFAVVCCFLRKRASKKYHTFTEDSIGNDLLDIESLQFDLAAIEAATNSFSDENKIGQGGFGSIYKGTLPNGQEIAVKRLSVTSLQGDLAFRNEAALLAKLQHRNLVRLLGFILEGQEKILVYEYIPNKSLDHFLFDPQKKGVLDWPRRYKIIMGIARGILYLHEESQLKIIHRDLKVSNILLDTNMNPKISDFGIARIFQEDQTRVNTRRIVGTLGYMSPEYAMHGQFSLKSDVFSFGVLALEIISGKKNTDFYQSHHNNDLLSYAWKNWRGKTPLELLDPTLQGSYSRNEVMRCIHIALLCVQENPFDRPSMPNVALMLDSYSITMTLPRKPPSFLHGRTPKRLKDGFDSDQSPC